MPADHVMLLSVPALRPRDVNATTTPVLYEWANQGALAELVPTFPCVTSPVQASMATGAPPGDHGVIANGFYDRAKHEVAFWVSPNSVIAGEQMWDALRARRPDATSAVWHVQNIKGAGADWIVTPAPIHEPDGTTKLWCYSKPDGLYASMLDELGHFPLQHYWGPLSNIESTRWILNAVLWLTARHAPRFQWVYVPHLDYASQKHGPNSPEAQAALVELDRELAGFVRYLDSIEGVGDVVFLVAGEYAMTDVSSVVYPNRLLRDADLLAAREVDGAEQIDLASSRAFAMVDHQLAHVFVNDGSPATVDACKGLFDGALGVAAVYAGREREQVGLNHERSGDLVLVSEESSWFAYYWWLEDGQAPSFARTVDIHSKPGYDAAELFIDPDTRAISLDAGLVKGSHGVPATGSHHRTALICSGTSHIVEPGRQYRDTDIKGQVQSWLLGE